jgi:predicted nucleic acid-binding protein
MATVLDTDVLSELRLPRPDPNVSAWLAAQAQDDLAIAAFSVVEIKYGIARAQQNSQLATRLAAWLDAIIATQRILPLNADGARVFGRLLAVPALRNLIAAPPRARKPRFAGDLAIAAIAVAHQATIATRNLMDFRLIAQHCAGLAGIDPWTGRTF